MLKNAWLSLLFVAHVCLLTIAAIPWEAAERPLGGQSVIVWRQDDASRAAVVIRRTVAASYWQTQPLRALSRPYIDALGLHQAWSMFSTPARATIFAHIRAVTVGGETTVVERLKARRMVFPQPPGARWRPIASIRHSYWDKAFDYVLMGYWGHLYQPGGSLALEETHDHFRGLLRVLTKQELRKLGPGRRLSRTELWVAAASIPAPWEHVSDATFDERRRRIDEYYRGFTERLESDSDAPLPGTSEQDGDLRWTFVASHDANLEPSR